MTTRSIICAMIVTTVLRTIVSNTDACLISEYRCNTGNCVSLDRYCNGADDCGDKSDEPPYCTPCNRTYYGEVGKTYELEIRRPREDRMPFLCYLNFTANSDTFGDLVQITFDTFTVGKFISYVIEGCPDGYMTIEEINMPFIGGQWCGSAWGYTVYYSETASLNLTLYLVRLSEQGIGYNFDFKISYKFLRKIDAYLRYGNSTVPTWRGTLIPSTYCDRILDQCDVRQCKIQSPNYPGVYPRNVTCYYRVEDRMKKRNQHSLISIGQRNAHKVHIKDQVIKYERSQRKLKVWEQCNVIQDYLTVYDGMSTEDPVLVRLCGGDVVPEITSSGPNMLLEFHTSPYDNPFHPVPLSYLPGFELDVKVIYVDARSQTYIRDRKCDFLISSFNQETKWGYLENTRHSLPPNTTCTYRFQGRAYQNVWIAFVKYYAASTDPTAYRLDEDCNARLRIWDGVVEDVKTDFQKNATLLGEFCKRDAPKLCDHSMLANTSRFTRPCALSESYVSTGNDLTLDIYLRRGSVLFPLDFQLRYEFVDNIPITGIGGGRLIVGPSLSSKSGSKSGSKFGSKSGSTSVDRGCDLLFDSSSSSSSSAISGKFNSPRNVFLYGRGGATNLTCRLTFVPKSEETVRLKFDRLKFARPYCRTDVDKRTGRSKCVYYNDNKRNDAGIAEIWISEYPWPGVRIARHCLCSNLDGRQPFVMSGLTSSALEVNFTVTNMNVTEDYDDYKFEGEYRFMNLISTSDSNICAKFKASRKVRGPSGIITNSLGVDQINVPLPPPPPQSSSSSTGTDENILIVSNNIGNGISSKRVNPLQMCGQQPWLIEPDDSTGRSYLYVKIKGFELSSSSFQCPTSNRILVYTISDSRNPKVICPSDETEDDLYLIEIFSDGWNVDNDRNLDSVGLYARSRSLLIEFIDIVPAVYTVRWLEVTKRPRYRDPTIDGTLLTGTISSQIYDCPYKCPELNACIKPELWCDGFRHCRSGYDENDVNCLHMAVPLLPAYLIAGGGIMLIVMMVLIIVACWCKCRLRRAKERRRRRCSRPSSISCSSLAAYKSPCRPDVVGSTTVGEVLNGPFDNRLFNSNNTNNSNINKRQKKPSQKVNKKNKKRISHKTNDGDDFDRNGDVYGERYNVNGNDFYLERKDSLC